ncbi:hypothetical protein Moror_10579 [Moniliophthora roreri MCA 2997]|uniref:Uncharacterized protein n=1 Tax=Moniliophthora roreri (strain MCA 2997) TaxID=1381753 RepID=V2XGY9_MONRO|nr:hypothetical protein Moror_10579 [Moniliophthora roreri MCA 2997]
MTLPGHVEGNLNFVAIRNGWTRNFTLSPSQVAKMDYSTLESVLELQTIKVRYTLRIFVEEPAGSGTFVKVRPWKEDGSLQSILLKSYFEDRMNNGTITTIDVRDGKAPLDSAVREGFSPEKAREWFRAHGLGGMANGHAADGATADDVSEDKQETNDSLKPPPTHGSGFFGFFKSNGAPASSATSSAPVTPSEDDVPRTPPPEAEKREEDILRERGWQPILRRLTTKKSRKIKEEADIQAEGDGEEVEVPDGEEANEMPERNGKWSKSRFLNSPKKGARKEKEKEKEKEKFKGAEVVPTLQDAVSPPSETPPKDD